MTLRADARRNRGRVLEVAIRMLAERGHAVSFDEIAREAGVGVGTVYRHFPAREDLLRAVFEAGMREQIEEAGALLSAGDPGAAFLGLFRGLVARAAVNKALCEAFDPAELRGMTPDPETGAAFDAAVGALLSRAQHAGQIRADLDTGDVRALVVGAATAVRARGAERAPHLVEMVVQTLRAQPSNETRDETCCQVCGTPLRAARTGRPARYCSASCRQRAHRARRRHISPVEQSEPPPPE
jgi:AcrR family transcriptional regulator